MSSKRQPARVIAVTSGKGGVGKTTAATNLAIALATRNQRVCLFDADTGLANVNILLGTQPDFTLQHVINGDRSIHGIMMGGPRNLQVVPGASGVEDMATLDEQQFQRLAEGLEVLENEFDYVIVDTGAGIENGVLAHIRSAHCAMLVITNEPTSLTDAFALIRVLKRKDQLVPLYVLVNRVPNYQHSVKTFKRFASAVKRYLNVRVGYMGYVPDDSAVSDAIQQQQPFVVSKPYAPASHSMFTLATGIEKLFRNSVTGRHFSQFWKQQRRPVLADAVRPRPRIENKPQLKLAATASLESLFKAIIAHVRVQNPRPTALRKGIALLVDGYESRFKRSPLNLRLHFYADLERRGFPPQELLEIIQTLEDAYRKQHDGPAHSSSDQLVRALARGDMPEEEYLELALVLERSYRRRYGNALFMSRQVQRRPIASEPLQPVK